ncbi:MAG: hypothetical protein ACI4I4_05595 [Acutalibacteraceae bacterium]
MKIKLSWLFFIPLFIATVLLRVYQVLFIDNGILKGFFDGGLVSIAFVGAILLMFVILIALCIADKKTSGVYRFHRNIPAGIFAVLTGIAVIADLAVRGMSVFGLGIGAENLGSAFFVSEFSVNLVTNVLNIIDLIASIFGGIAFIFIGAASLSGKRLTYKRRGLMLAPVLWVCMRMVITFASYTHVAVNAQDMSDLIFLVFATLFTFNLCLIFSNTKGKNPVKACFLYGMPAIALAFAYCAARIVAIISSGAQFDVLANICVPEYICFALFMLFFIAELSGKATAKTDDEKSEKKSEDKTYEAPERLEKKSTIGENKRENLSEARVRVKDQYLAQADEIVERVEHGNAEDEDYVFASGGEQQEKETPGTYGVNLDDIDRLILEISSRREE